MSRRWKTPAFKELQLHNELSNNLPNAMQKLGERGSAEVHNCEQHRLYVRLLVGHHRILCIAGKVVALLCTSRAAICFLTTSKHIHAQTQLHLKSQPRHNSLATSFHVRAQKQQTSKSLLKQGIIRARDSNKFFRFHPSIQCSLTRQSACESVRPAGSGQAGSPSVHFKCCQQSTVIGCAFYSSYSSHRWLHADAVFIYEC